jgi:hypothetical protein
VEKVQFLASQPHYVDHLRPVYEALPEEVRGVFATNRNELAPKTLTVVSSYADLLVVKNCPVVFFEHGTGFRYNNNHPSYSGSAKRDGVVLFCNVNRIVESRNQEVNPDAKHVIVGCPKLDSLVAAKFIPDDNAEVAFSWHWECTVAPETRSAWKHYQPHLRQTAEEAKGLWAPIGHAHPRAWKTVVKDYEAWNWCTARSFSDVCARADVYVCDTSSTIYEFAALGRPVVILNAPWYRKNVHHGLRFWDHIPGIQVDDPRNLNAAIREALENDTWAEERKRITDIVYPYIGEASQRAAAAILEVL